jgi:hypothetical protein
MTQRQIPMGAGLLPPHHTVTVPTATPAPRRGARRVLGALAVASPVLFAAFVAIDPGPLPREPAAEFLGAIAASPDRYVLATTFQVAAMATGLALAVAVGVAFRLSSRWLSGVAAALMATGCLGGAGFAGAKLVAADLVVGGEVRPGAEETWTAVQQGPLFDVMSWPLLMAIVGTVVVTAVLVRARAEVSWWPAVLYLAGFVLGSGEFPDLVTFLGPVVQIPAVVVIARRLQQAD